MALMVLLTTVIGAPTIADILNASPAVHRSLANAPRRRKPHLRYSWNTTMERRGRK